MFLNFESIRIWLYETIKICLCNLIIVWQVGYEEILILRYIEVLVNAYVHDRCLGEKDRIVTHPFKINSLALTTRASIFYQIL